MDAVKFNELCRYSIDVGFVDVNPGIVGRKLIGKMRHSATNNEVLGISRTQSHITDNSTLLPVLQRSDDLTHSSKFEADDCHKSSKSKYARQSKSSEALVSNNSKVLKKHW